MRIPLVDNAVRHADASVGDGPIQRRHQMTRARLWWRLVVLSFKTVVTVGLFDVTDAERADVAREVEDIHRDLGHTFYDWRTHGGSWADFVHRGDGE